MTETPLTADTLTAGALWRRGDDVWTVESSVVETPRLGAPVVRLRCIDHNGEVRTLTVPADMPVVRHGDVTGPVIDVPG